MILIILAHLICAGAWGGELEPKFSSIKQNILEPHCAECHGPGGSQSAIDIFSYKYLRDPDAPLVIPGNLKDSDLYTEVSTYDMPPAPRDRLSENQLSAIKTWIEQGALNN